jgi:hypothetical protein
MHPVRLIVLGVIPCGATSAIHGIMGSTVGLVKRENIFEVIPRKLVVGRIYIRFDRENGILETQFGQLPLINLFYHHTS